MGLWAQNVGVKAPSLPPAVLARASSETFGIPEQMERWSWATLGDFVDLGELDALAAEAGDHAGAPVLAFSVHDSDSVYLVGADASGVRFRLVVNPEAWEDELPRQELEEAAAWSKDHAPLDPSPDDIAEILARQFVFAEEGLDVVLARMGLLPPEAAEGAEELGTALSELGEVDVWSTLESVASPEERVLERDRWYATFQHGDVRGHLLAADEDSTAIVITPAVDQAVTEVPAETVSGYAVRPDKPVVFLGQMSTREDLWHDLTRQGVQLGPWEVIPDSVPRDLASTAAWLLRG